MALTNNLIDNFINVLGSTNVLINHSDRLVYSCDAETIDMGLPDLVLLPNSTKQVSEVIKLAALSDIKIVPRGAGTGLSGGATPYLGGVCLSLTRMNRVLEIDKDSHFAHVECGVTNSTVSKFAKPYNLYFPCDPSSQAASTIGGNIAENAGGSHTLKYGTTTSHVNGLIMVDNLGSIVKMGSKTTNSLGFDFSHLVCGSEGTFGVVCEAFLNLIPIARSIETLIVYFDNLEHAAELVSAIIANGIIPAALELIDDVTLKAVEANLKLGLDITSKALMIVEIEGNFNQVLEHKNQISNLMRSFKIMGYNWTANEIERNKIWKARKASFASLGSLASHGYVLDGVIPRSKLAQAIIEIRNIAQRYDLLVANVYHAGDGNLHPCLLFNKGESGSLDKVIRASREILLMCLQMGGALSGEHGVGVEKIFEMNDAFNTETLNYMTDIKLLFDNGQIFNPGKVLPNPKICGESRIANLKKFNLMC